jgi:hypothetical protein
VATIRVFLITCRRSHLLRRALRSLLAQTNTDWVCELHNDAPEDHAPEAVLSELAPGDSRFTYCHHDPAWGAVASFNHCFRAGQEAFAALLEDDNWWEPALLGELKGALEAHPEAELAWANMRVWREDEDGSWIDTGRNVWPEAVAPRLFEWPVLLQAFDGLHSNGAMLFRKPAEPPATVPPETPFGIIEPVRERALSGLLLVPRPLANYALTRNSARSRDRSLWVAGQLLVAASFFGAVPLSKDAWDELWMLCRRARPRRTTLLLLLALAGVCRREIICRARPSDLLRFLREFAGSPRANLRGLRFRRSHPRLWAWLCAESAARTDDARRRGWVSLAAGSLFTK